MKCEIWKLPKKYYSLTGYIIRHYDSINNKLLKLLKTSHNDNNNNCFIALIIIFGHVTLKIIVNFNVGKMCIQYIIFIDE